MTKKKTLVQNTLALITDASLAKKGRYDATIIAMTLLTHTRQRSVKQWARESPEFPDRRFPTPRKAKRVAEEEYQTKVAYTTEEAEHDLAQQFSTWFKERLHWAATGITLDSANLVSDLHMCQKAGKQR